MSDETDVGVAGCLASLFAMPFAFALHGWVLATLWGWFVVPFFGLRALSVPLAIGLVLVVSCLRPVPHDYAKDDTSTPVKIVLTFVAPLVALGVGAIVRMFL